MSVYYKDSPEWLKQSIGSMLKQTVEPAEFIIVKDGPVTQKINKVLDHYKKSHPELFNIIQLKENVGLGLALRTGIENCHNEYIARIDADDYAVPKRVETQLNIFKKHPELGLVGSNVEEFSDTIDNVISHVVLPEKHQDIYSFAKKRCPFRHPSLLYKKSAVLTAGNYRSYHLCEDYDLYTRLLQTGCKCFNIQKPLTYMRVDKDFYKRRGGIKYLKSILKFKNEQVATGFFSKKDYVVSATPHIITCLMPNALRDWTYRKLLRRKGDTTPNIKSYLGNKVFRQLALYITIVFPLLGENLLSTALGDTISKILSVISCAIIFIIAIKYYFKHRTFHINAFFVIMLLLIALHTIITFFVAPDGLTIATNNNMITPYGLIGYFMLFILIDICSKDKKDLILLFKAMTIVMTIAVLANIFITGDLRIANNIATLSEAARTKYTNSRKWLFGHRNLIFIHHLMWLLVTSIYYKLKNKNYKKMFLIQMGITIAVSILSWNSTMIITTFVILILYVVKLNIFRKANILHFITLYFIAEIGIVFLRLQNAFSFIIKDVLHRSLTFTGRTTIWDHYIEQFNAGGLAQKMFGNSGITTLKANTHNMFLGLLSFTGIVGVVLYFGLVFLSAKQLWANRKEESTRLVSIIIFGFLINALTMEFYLQPLFAFFIGYNIQHINNMATTDSRAPTKSTKKKILYMINFITDGGPSRVLENIIKGVNPKKYDIYVMTLINRNSMHAIRAFSQYNINFIHLDYDKNLISVLKKRRTITKIVHNIAPDIIHVHGIVSTLLISMININCKKISTIHNNMFEDYKFTYGNKKGPLFSIIHLIANKRFDNIICCSKSAYNAIKKFNKNTTFILNGVDVTVPVNQNKIKTDIRKELQIKQDAFIYIYCGVINQRKRVVELVELFNSSLSEDEYFIIVGNGELAQEAKQKAKNKRIIFTGFQEKTINYMLASDVYVSNSSSEGLSISVVEALACGMPLLLSNIPSHNECFEIDKQYYIGEAFSQENFTHSKNNLRQHKVNHKKIIEFQKKYLSSSIMSQKYNQYYK